MKQNAFTQLLDRYLSGTATGKEIDLVEIYLDELEKGPVKQRTPEEEEALLALMLKNIKAGLRPRPSLLVRMSDRWKVGVAAAIVLVAVSVWLVVSNGSKRPDTIPSQVAQKDINAPGVNRAMITLADGRRVFLDSVGSGELALQENIKLVKLSDGQIAYQSSNGEIIKELKYNTLSNPRGSKVIDIRLSDGSHVWLNSGSSITYPVAFVGGDRKVTIEGEAYFEVAHDKTKPFIVSRGDMTVQVLGTHFNVNAYNDEADIKVTLLEGSVRVVKGNNAGMLKPGEQARINSDITVLKDVDVDGIMAWKEGIFLFDNTDLATIMRQISRWYDVTVVYEGKMPNTKFGGGVSKDQPLSKILETLERYGLHFELDRKTLKVSNN
jgi:transmembrane sensor